MVQNKKRENKKKKIKRKRDSPHKALSTNVQIRISTRGVSNAFWINILMRKTLRVGAQKEKNQNE